jgi:membrane-associated phospholipid phosphatase
MKKLFSSIFFWIILLFWILGFILIINTDQLELHKKLNGFNTSILDKIVPYATYIGDGLFAILLVVFFFFFKKKHSLILLLSFLISSGITQFLKQVVFPNVMRPFHYFQNDDCFHLVKGVVMHTQNSFPSGHATTCFAIFTTFTLFWKNDQRLQGLFAFGAILFALTRVYLSQHFLEDVLAGSFIGTITAYLVCQYLPRIDFVKKLEE